MLLFFRNSIWCLIFLCVCIGNLSRAQSNWSIKYFGLTIHPFGDASADIQPYKLDENAYFVLNFGGYVGYEKFIWNDFLSVKLKQGLFTDCSAGWMGVTHLGLQMKLIEGEKHRLSFGAGPTLIYRESWTRFDFYEKNPFWNYYNSNRLGEVQWRTMLYGCEFVYDYRLTENLELSSGFTPGFPMAFTFSIGVKYWMSREFEQKYFLARPKRKKRR
jgi:hypothetical protein